MSTLPRVLLINSDPGTRELLRWLFHLHAEQVIEAAGSVETPALIRELRPTVVLMDPCLHGLSGDTLLRRIQQTAPGLPVVVYTDPITATRAVHVHGVTTVVIQGEHQLDALLAAVQRAHDDYSSGSAPPGGGVVPARPAATAGLLLSAGRAELLTHAASTTGRR